MIYREIHHSFALRLALHACFEGGEITRQRVSELTAKAVGWYMCDCVFMGDLSSHFLAGLNLRPKGQAICTFLAQGPELLTQRHSKGPDGAPGPKTFERP